MEKRWRDCLDGTHMFLGTAAERSSAYNNTTKACPGTVKAAVLIGFTVLALTVLVVLGGQGSFSIFISRESGSIGFAVQDDRAANLERPRSSARSLIDAIKMATRAASRANETLELTSEERDRWIREHPCESRSQLMPMYFRRKYVNHLPDNPLWDEVFHEYSKLHRVCTQSVRDITNYFLSGNTSTGCKFVVGDISDYTGLGNKVVVSVSSLLYAILTQRVLLIPSPTLFPSVMCEPFPGSSWLLDLKTFPIPPERHPELWKMDRDFFQDIDRQSGISSGNEQVAQPIFAYATGVIKHEWQPASRFYCTAEQGFYSKATWVYLSGCIYTIPKLFATPLFRLELEGLFPDRMVLTRLLRTALLPADRVWSRVKRINDANLEHANRRIGIQVRYKDGEHHYNEMNDIVNKRVEECVLKHKILPEIVRDPNPAYVSINSSSPAPEVTVLIASLFEGLRDHLTKIYSRSPTVTGERIQMVQVTHGTRQQFHLEEDTQAFAEVLALSFSDELLVTPISTFGYLAYGYGGITPWFINYRNGKNSGEPCERAQTVDACDQFTYKTYSCRYDPDIDRKEYSKVVPYIRDCLDIDHNQGLQLVTGFHS